MKTKRDPLALPAFLLALMSADDGGDEGGGGGGASPPPPPPPSSPFGELSEDNKRYQDVKKYGNANDVFDALRNAESFVGLDKSQMLKLPADRSDPSKLGDVFEALGRPKDAAGYGLKADPERGLDGPLFEKFPDVALKLNLLPFQVAGLTEFIGAQYADAAKANADAEGASFAEGETKIKELFGDAHDDKVAAINALFEEHGSGELDDYLFKSGRGNDPAFAKFMDKIVQLVSEPGKLPGEPGRDNKFGGKLSPGEAQAKLAAFDAANDAALRSKAHPEHNALVKQRLDLIAQAYPETK